MKPKPITLLKKTQVLKTFPFAVEEIYFEYEDLKPEKPYHRLHCPDWVNVLPVTAKQEVVLIEQPRVGSMCSILETPGGVIDPTDVEPELAARRELEEETGLVCPTWRALGDVNPNPAIMNNRCFFFLALDCYEPEKRSHQPDNHERILLHKVPIERFFSFLAENRIDHALSALCIQWARPFLKQAET